MAQEKKAAPKEEKVKGLEESQPDIEQVSNMLGYLWIDNTEQEAYQTWRRYVEMNPPKGAELLNQFTRFLASPPPNFSDILEQNWILLYHRDPVKGQTPYSLEEKLAWFKTMVEKLKDITDEVSGGK